MPRRADRRILSFGTDGLSFYYRPGAEIGEEDFRHMLMHCIFRHMFPPERADRSLWDLACDMSAEYLREEILPTGKSGQVRYSVTGALPEGCDPRSAISVYRGLSELYKDELAVLRGRFPRDDHRYWYERPERAPALPGSGEGEGGLGISLGEGEEYAQRLRSLLDERWGEIAETLLPKRGEKKKYGLAPGSREEKMLLRQEGKYDFTRYLRRFSHLEGRFYALSHLFVWTMMLVVLVDNMGLMWVAIEATTLISALLVAFKFTRTSLEAAWKYVMVCTVGICLAAWRFWAPFSFTMPSCRLLAPSWLWTLPIWPSMAKTCLRALPRLPSPSSLWAMARRLAWRPCMPGCRMPIPRHRPSPAACSPGRFASAPSMCCCGL